MKLFKNTDWYLTYCISMVVLLFLVIGFAVWSGYNLANEGGYYCEYCHQGSQRNINDVKRWYGTKPCTVAKDSVHHFIYWNRNPQLDDVKYKYVRE